MQFNLRIHESFFKDMRRVSIKLAILAAVLLCLKLISMPAELKGIAGYVPLHTFFETLSILIAGLTFSVIWNSPRTNLSWSRVLLACALAGVALLDFSHMLSIQGMPVYITPGDPEKAINFWLAARYLAAVSLLIICISPLTPLKSAYTKYWMMAGILTFVVLTHYLFLFEPALVPRTFIKGLGLTTFKVAAEYFLIALNLVAGLALLLRMRGPLTFNAPSLFAAVIAMAMSEFLFTLYGDLTDIYLVAGHLFKIFSYFFLYQAVFVETIKKPYEEINALQISTQEKSNFIRVIADNTPGMLAFWNRDLRCEFSNREYLDWFGRTQEQMQGISMQALLGEELFHQNEPYIRSALLGKAQKFERTLMKPSGETSFTWAQYIPRWSNGEVVGFFVLVSDITQLKQKEIALQLSEQRLQLAMSSADLGLWDWNVPSGQVVLDSRWCSMLGYEQVELEPHVNTCLSLLHPEDATTVQPILDAHLKGESPDYTVEFRMKHKDGHWVWIAAMGKVVERDNMGAPLRMTGTHLDISERKQKEREALELREQLARATKMESIGHLTGGIAHDFNNILGAIMGYAELSQSLMSAKPEVYGSVPRYMGEILAGSNRAKQLIQKMLVFSRRSPELNESPASAVLLEPVMQEVVGLLRSSIPATIALNYEVRQENLKAKIEPVNLHQIMMNLGINARDAIGEYGSIVFNLGAYEAEQYICSACNKPIEGSFVDISVTDSGTGIPEANVHFVFDPFFTTKDVGKGTGMGLSVVHGIVHQVGGHIVLESEIGVGTTFHILLPRVISVEPVVSVTQTVLTPGLNLTGLKILIVDDEKIMAAMLKDLLESQGGVITTFNEPLEALEAFRKNPAHFDLMITDETMPKLTGLHLSEKILALRPDFPIILCTGYSEHATPELAAQQGIAGFFYKPLDMAQLLLKIQAICSAKPT